MGLWVIGTAVVLLVVFGLLALAFFQTFYPDAPAPDYPLAKNRTMAQQQDLDYFQNYFTLNHAYSPEALARAKALYGEAQTHDGTLSPGAFTLTIARMVALSDNGHSGISKRYLSTRYNRIPCRLYRFDYGYYVIRARPTCTVSTQPLRPIHRADLHRIAGASERSGCGDAIGSVEHAPAIARRQRA